METATDLSKPARAYLRIVCVLGVLVLARSILELVRAPLQPQWILLAVLTVISGSASVYLPWAHASISISEAFVFTAVLLYGAAAGTVTVALDCLVISFWIAKRRPELERALFNIAAPVLSAWCSAQLFFLTSQVAPLSTQPGNLDPLANLNAILPSLILFALVYYGLNSWLIAFMIAFEKGTNAWTVWRTNFIWLSLNYFCGASLAVFLVGYNRTIDLRFVAVVVPLLLVLYFTFRTSMQRVEDANKHIDQLNALYLSTIETLAMAVDAKDQVTHGHIRRVQSHTILLARAIGVRDEKLLKAIEAAALLHDMGKLAVPEHILNKPGKLTETEFEKMKLHAAIGADILSAIDFPYPVVPIVRHHHENWNGTGYPAGLRQTEIPIGARVLSVVDCFDALTSDRPYRPRLSDEEAIQILLDRRGSMYDPLVVDTFIQIHGTMPETIPTAGPGREIHRTIQDSRRSSSIASLPAVDDIAASTDEMLTLTELVRALGSSVGIGDAGDAIAKHLQRLIPCSLCVFFLYDVERDELEASHAVGDGHSAVQGLRIPLGQRLSGWVAANRHTICNSDPTLDLNEIAHSGSSRLRSCMSTPLLSGDVLIGVLSLYSVETDAFTDNHKRIIELVATEIARTFQRSAKFDDLRHRVVATSLPTVKQLD